MPNEKFDLFISHNSKDKDAIDAIAKRLSDEYDIHPWLDKWSLVAATNWAPAIEKALQNCGACAVVLGENGWGPHHLGEAQLALKRKREFPDFRVIPILLPGASAENMRVVGDFFQQVHRVELKAGANEDEAFQRLWAAVRGEAPGPPLISAYKIERDAKYWQRLPLKNKKIALYAGEKLLDAQEIARLEGTKVSEVVRNFLRASVEDEQSRIREGQRRTRRIMAGLAIGLVLVASLAVVANDLRKRANVERERAVAAALNESEARKEAESERDNAQKAAEKELQARRDEEKQRKEAEKQTEIAKKQRQEAVKQQRRAEEQTLIAEDRRREAERERNIAISRQFAASSISELLTDPEASVRLAREGALKADTSQSEESLRRSLSESHVRLVMRGQSDRLVEAVYSPDGKIVATFSVDGTAALWDSATGEKKSDLVAHTDVIKAMVFSPSGEMLVTASSDETAVVWDVKTGMQVSMIDARSGSLNGAVFSNDNKLIALSSESGGVSVWDARTGELTKTLEKGGNFGAHSVAFSPNGKLIAATYGNGTAHIWQTSDWAHLKVLTGHNRQKNVVGVAFSPDDQTILTASADGTARIWDVATGAQKFKLLFSDNEVLEEPVKSGGGHAIGSNQIIMEGQFLASFSPDGKLIITVDDYTVRLWEAASGKKLTELIGHEGLVSSASFSPNSKYVVTSSLDNKARVWDASSGKIILAFRGHTDPILSARFSPDGESVVTASVDKTARVWDSGLGKLKYILRGRGEGILPAEFNKGGTLAVTTEMNGVPHIWDAHTGRVVAVLKGGDDGVVMSAAFDTAGERVVTSAEKGVSVWNARTGEHLVKMEGAAEESVETLLRREVIKAAFSPDGGLVAAPNEDTVVVWDARTGEKKAETEEHNDGLSDYSFSPDSRRLVTVGGNDAKAYVWDARTGERVYELEGNFGAVACARYSPDNKLIVTGSDDFMARIWDASTGKELKLLTGHSGKILKALFSPDSRSVLTVSLDGTVRIWDASTGRNIATSAEAAGQGLPAAAIMPGGIGWLWAVSGSTWGVTDASFSPNSKFALIAKPDGTVCVLDISAKQSLALFRRNEGPIVAASFSPDGRAIITAGLDNTAVVYECEVCGRRDELLNLAESRILPAATAAPTRGRRANMGQSLSFAPADIERTRRIVRFRIDQIIYAVINDFGGYILSPDTSLRDESEIGLGEKLPDLFAALERRLFVPFAESETRKLKTVGDIYRYVESQLETGNKK
jgi:WD40 repeat protein